MRLLFDNSSVSFPDQSSVVDLKSTNKGILIPRMTEAERLSMNDQPGGLTIYQIDGRAGFWYNYGSTSSPEWRILSAEDSYIIDHDEDTEISVEKAPDADNVRITIDNNLAALISHDGNNSKLEPKSNLGNTLIGDMTSSNLTTGAENTALGSQSLHKTTKGSKNTSIGYQSMYSNIEGNDNTAFGTQSLFHNIGNNTSTLDPGSKNTAVGYQSLYNNVNGKENTAIGFQSLKNNGPGLPGSSSYNVALGRSALLNNTSASNNVSIGALSGLGTRTGSGNVFIGYLSGLTSNDGIYNVAIGSHSFKAADGSNYNVAIGHGTLNNPTPVQLIGNTAIGYEAGAHATGNYSVYIGYRAGYSNATDDRLIIENKNLGYTDPLVLGKFDEKIVEINDILRLKPLSAEPQGCTTTGEEGQIYYDKSTSKLRVCTATGWKDSIL